MKYKLEIHFTGDVYVELDNDVYTIDNINLKMREAGLRPWRITNVDGVIQVIPLNAKNIVRILATPIEEEVVMPTGNPIVEKIIAEETMIPEEEKKVEERKETDQEKNDRIMQEMIEKSNCTHEFDKLELGYKDTSNGKRYQPVCTFCGHRLRYIGVNKIKEGKYEDTPTPWTMQHILDAKLLPEI